MPSENVGDPSNGNPAGFIRGLINEGERPTAGLDIYREAGGHIQDARWFSLYQQVANTYNDRPAMLGLDPYSAPGPTDYETWAFGRGGQYATQVQMQMVERDTGEFVTMQYTHLTDEPHTPAEAEAAAWDSFDPEVTGSDWDQTMMGATFTAVARTVPYA